MDFKPNIEQSGQANVASDDFIMLMVVSFNIEKASYFRSLVPICRLCYVGL